MKKSYTRPLYPFALLEYLLAALDSVNRAGSYQGNLESKLQAMQACLGIEIQL